MLAERTRGAARPRQLPPQGACARSTCCASPTPRNQAELAWRFGLLLGAANLLLLGIGLAATNPRRASNWNLLFALLAFVVYYNLINLSQAWVASGRLSAWARRCWRCTARAFALALALLVVARPCGDCAGACARPPARRRRMKTVRRLLYRDIVVVGAVRRAGLPVAVLLHRLRRRARRRRPPRLHGAGTRAAGRGARAARPLLRAVPDRGADRHHLFAGAAWRSRPSSRSCAPAAWARAARWRCWPCWACVFGVLTFVVGDYVAPASERAGGAAAGALQRRLRARRRRRLAEGAPQHRRDGERSYSVNVAGATSRRRAGGHPHLRVRRRRPAVSRTEARAGPRGRRRQLDSWPTPTVTRLARRRAATPMRRVVASSSSPRSTGRARCTRGVVAAAVLPVSTMSTRRAVALQRAT